jgi:hypothetical protein
MSTSQTNRLKVFENRVLRRILGTELVWLRIGTGGELL